MAPTETLAEQHFATLELLLAGANVPIALLTGSSKAASRRRTLEALATGELPLVVGTHALIEPAVEFARLAVVVVDEQHRFGVRQRRALDGKGPAGLAPHVLHMTATPIPRTLSLTAYGDLDTTALRELPAGRRPIKTWHAGEDRRDGAYGFIRDRLDEGRQAFVVCPLVSESESAQAKAATVEAERLRAGELARLRGRGPPRPDAGGGQVRRDGAVRRRRGAGSRGDERDRGRDRRPQRERDADRGSGPLRPEPAAPAARAHRPRRARVALHPLRRPRVGAGAGSASRRSCGSATAFASPRSTSSCAARARCSARARAGCRGFRVASLPEDVRPAARGPRGPDRPARRARLARGAGARPADGRGPRSLRRRAHRAHRRMRVIAGELGGRRLRAPRGELVRPTSDRVREALFSILGDVEGMTVLDLYCGTGALGIEALSRGAARATFVDTPSARSSATSPTSVSPTAARGHRAATRSLTCERDRVGPSTWCFCDPPYNAPRLGARSRRTLVPGSGRMPA